ncbi:hypothetical protein, variant [Capsaspora owczarzaki ATCC 30864]|nr:hypothetical protein, variant [Capsaspora owczarzaki ATCC 30864]
MLDAYTAQPTPLDEKSLARIAELFSGYKEDHATRDKLVRQSLKWSTAVGRNTRGDPSLHHLFGTAFWREHNYQLAESHLVLGTEASALSLAEMLLEWSQKGSPSELELFITRAVLKYLELGNLRDANVLFRTFTAQHPSIRNPPFRLPLLNFCHFLLATLERDAAPLFKMLREKYRPSLQRDASFDASLDAIGQCFFNIRSSSGVSSMPGISEMLRTMLGS